MFLCDRERCRVRVAGDPDHGYHPFHIILGGLGMAALLSCQAAVTAVLF